jgi:hypothetical protein
MASTTEQKTYMYLDIKITTAETKNKKAPYGETSDKI